VILPRSRRFQLLLFLLTVIAMAVPPLVNHIRTVQSQSWPLYTDAQTQPDYVIPHGNKDYPLWYSVGRVVVEDAHLRQATGEPWLLYPTSEAVPFPFMYPPFAALVLAGLSLLGSTGMIVALILLNALSLAVVIELTVKLLMEPGQDSLWLRILPAALSIFFINDMFLLGQPNLGLLGLILLGLFLHRKQRMWQVVAGLLFALAAAIKAFPVVVLIYLVWRRAWWTAGSMVIGCVLFFVAAPALVRGPERALAELKTWATGMLLTNNENGLGQRPEQSVGWRNQSIFGVMQRLVGPGIANAEESLNRPNEAVSISLVQLDHSTTKWLTYALCAALGLVFVAVLPPVAARSQATDAVEYGLLIILMTIGTPYAFGYYFVWMIYPLAVVIHHGLTHGGALTLRNIAWDVVAVVAVLYAMSAPIGGNIYPMAYGSLFWAAMVLLAGCCWLLRRTRLLEAQTKRSTSSGAAR
jgi:hypothetical protein